MKTMKLMLTVLVALFAMTANAQSNELVTKYKGQDGVKSEDMMADVKRMVDMFAQMPAQGGGAPGMPDMSAMAAQLKTIKTYTVLTPSGDKAAAMKADVEALKSKGYTTLIEFVEGDGGMGQMGAMPEPKAGPDGVKRLQLPNMFQQMGGGSMQAYAKVTDNKFNEVIFFSAGQQTSLSFVEANGLTVDNLMMIMMIPMMRNMQGGGGFGGGF